MNQYGTIIADEATIMAQFLKDNFPDANGRYGLFICNKTCNYRLVIIRNNIYFLQKLSKL